MADVAGILADRTNVRFLFGQVKIVPDNDEPHIHRQQGKGLRRDGREIDIHVAASSMTLDGRSLYIAVVRDISKEKAIEEMKSNFVSTVSHELRTPLTSIRGSLGLLAGGALGELPDALRDVIGIAHTISERLVRLVNDILDIRRLEAGNMTLALESCAVRDLVEKTIFF